MIPNNSRNDDSMRDWQRLAQELKAVREAGGEHNREEFARKRGLPNSRTVLELERGVRDNYRPATLAEAEQWYGLEPGNIDEILTGGPVRLSAPDSDVTPPGDGALMQMFDNLRRGMSAEQEHELRVRLEAEGRKTRREQGL